MSRILSKPTVMPRTRQPQPWPFHYIPFDQVLTMEEMLFIDSRPRMGIEGRETCILKVYIFAGCKRVLFPADRNVEHRIVDKHQAIEFIMASPLYEGHVLMEDVLGFGKTMVARSIAASLGICLKRVQCTKGRRFDLYPHFKDFK